MRERKWVAPFIGRSRSDDILLLSLFLTSFFSLSSPPSLPLSFSREAPMGGSRQQLRKTSTNAQERNGGGGSAATRFCLGVDRVPFSFPPFLLFLFLWRHLEEGRRTDGRASPKLRCSTSQAGASPSLLLALVQRRPLSFCRGSCATSQDGTKTRTWEVWQDPPFFSPLFFFPSARNRKPYTKSPQGRPKNGRGERPSIFST